MKHDGNLTITKDNAEQFKDLVEVTGYLYINASAKLEAPALTTVGGDLSIYESAKLEAPALTTVGGDLCIHESAKLEALTTVGGDLYIHESAKLEAPALTTVGGYLHVHESAKLEALTTVGGDLSIYESAKLEAPALTTVGGDLSIYASAKLEALTTVGGYLYIRASAKLEALTTVGGDLCIHESAKLEAPVLKTKNNSEAKEICRKALELSFSLKGLIKIDGILSWLLGQKTIGEITIFEIRIVGKLTSSYAVKRGETYSHGETVEKAIEDLRYKLSDRDVSEFKSWDVNQKRNVDDLIQAYRSITGACEQGVREFCKSVDLKKEYSITEVVELTKSSFGNDKFKEFFA